MSAFVVSKQEMLFLMDEDITITKTVQPEPIHLSKIKYLQKYFQKITKMKYIHTPKEIVIGWNL